MNISNSTLLRQYSVAHHAWPFITEIEVKHNLPPFLLYALGSRETNLVNEIGDHGHGFGVWQRDNRSWNVDHRYLRDVRRQAEDAASLLRNDWTHVRDWRLACAAYNAGLGAVIHAINSGKDADSVTTGGDYGADVIARVKALELWGGGEPRPSFTLKRYLELHRFRYMRGEDVRRAQLIVRAYPDGRYGPETAYQVRSWQGHHGLKADGVVGPNTAKSFGWAWS